MLSASFHHRRVALAFVFAVATAAPAAAVAQVAPMRERGGDVRMEMMARGAQRDEGRSLSEAVRRVQRSTGGHILGAERVPFDGRDINRVKYMDERGRVRYMDDPVPPRSQPRTPRSDMSSLRSDNP